MPLFDFNMALREFFISFPMAVSKSDRFFMSTINREQMRKTLSVLQEKYDFVMQFLSSESVGPTNDRTILDANGLSVREVTPFEEAQIKEWMSDQKGNYINAYKVVNEKTEERFYEFCRENDLSDGAGGKGGYLLLFKVATGNPYYIYRHRNEGGKLSVPKHWRDFHKDPPDCLCTGLKWEKKETIL